MMLKRFTGAAIFFLILGLGTVFAEKQSVDIGQLRTIALPIHIIELILAIFICFMALKFFHITKPFNFFILVYIALGFFIINTLLYIFLYTGGLFNLQLSFVNVYLGGRFSLIAMLTLLGYIFFYIHVMMKKKIKGIQ